MWNKFVGGSLLLAVALCADMASAQPQPASAPGAALRERFEVHRDIAYAGTANPRQMLDLYLPRERGEERLPLIVWIHGGAWLAGSKDGVLAQMGEILASGDYAVASINYRLSGEAIWPAQIHDCKAAVRWLRAHAEQYGLDPERIGAMGPSAGGHLVAMLGTGGDVDALEGDLGDHLDVSSRVMCVINYFGPANLLTMNKYPTQMDHDAPDAPGALLLGGPLQDRKEQAREASPVTHVSEDDPPMLVVHGTADPLVPYGQSRELVTALREAGVDVTLITIEGGGHGGFRNPELTRRARAFFDRHLRAKDVVCEGGTLPNSL